MMTIERLGEMSIRVNVFGLGDAGLTSAAGRMTTDILNVVAQFERDLLGERTNAERDRARAQAKQLGWPLALTADRGEVTAVLRAGEKISPLARRFSTSCQAIRCIRDRHEASGTAARED